MNRAVAALTLVLTTAASSPAAGQVARQVAGGVAYEVVLLAPDDGHPLAGELAIVHRVYPAGLSSKTNADAEGRIRFDAQSPSDQIRIDVPDIGYLPVPPAAPSADGVLRPRLPRLVPYGAIECIVPEAMRAEVAEVRLADDSPNARRRDSGAPDREGRVVFRNLRVEEHVVQLRGASMNGGEGQPVARRSVWVRPGVTTTLRDFVLTRDFGPIIHKRAEGQATWCRGTLRTPAGAPIAGATVVAFASGSTSFDEYAPIAVTTDSLGRWEIVGDNPGGRFGFYVTLHYGKGGVHYGSRSFDDAGADSNRRKYVPPEFDLVAPERFGSLRVRGYRNGVPSAGIGIAIRPTIGWSSDRSHDEVFPPSKSTDADGYALFENLAPGSYDLITFHDNGREAYTTDFRYFALAVGRTGIAVRADTRTEYALHAIDSLSPATFELRSSDDVPVPANSMAAGFQFAAAYDSRLDLRHGSNDRGRFDLACGLWRATFSAGRLNALRQSRSTEFEEAHAVVAASPLLAGMEPVTLRAVRHRRAGLTIELRDEQDRPAHGQVHSYGLAGTSDEKGQVRFDFVPPQRLDFRVYRAEDSAAPDLRGNPSDAELIGKKRLLTQTISTVDDVDTHVVVRPQPVGYVRGRLIPAPSRTPADYRLFTGGGRWSDDTIHYDSSTGTFVAGPFGVDGPYRGLFVTTRRIDDPQNEDWEYVPCETFLVRSDRVVELTLTASLVAESTRAAASQRIRVAVDGADQDMPTVDDGRVFHADGFTPAPGALVRRLTSGSTVDRNILHTDGLGDFCLDQGGWDGMLARFPTPELPRPAEPLLIALLPGECGGVVLPMKSLPEHGAKIVLPRPVSVRGVVRVAGKSAADWRNRFLVTAEYLDRTDVSEMFDLTVDPSLDGSFELVGLTPGKYRVQASLDGIWLSSSIEIVVDGDGRSIGPLELDIPHPGLPSILRCADAEGRPVVGAKFTIRRPDGPLAERLWPAELIGDGAGTVHVPPLEAGEHVITCLDDHREHRLTIPPIPIPQTDGRMKRPEFRVVVEPKRSDGDAK
jgi:hypothetical protein